MTNLSESLESVSASLSIMPLMMFTVILFMMSAVSLVIHSIQMYKDEGIINLLSSFKTKWFYFLRSIGVVISVLSMLTIINVSNKIEDNIITHDDIFSYYFNTMFYYFIAAGLAVFIKALLLVLSIFFEYYKLVKKSKEISILSNDFITIANNIDFIDKQIKDNENFMAKYAKTESELMILNQKLHEQRILYNKLISDYSLNCK